MSLNDNEFVYTINGGQSEVVEGSTSYWLQSIWSNRWCGREGFGTTYDPPMSNAVSFRRMFSLFSIKDASISFCRTEGISCVDGGIAVRAPLSFNNNIAASEVVDISTFLRLLLNVAPTPSFCTCSRIQCFVRGEESSMWLCTRRKDFELCKQRVQRSRQSFKNENLIRELKVSWMTRKYRSVLGTFLTTGLRR